MVKRKSWTEFRSSGMLWWVNMLLHTMGWSIVVDVKDGVIQDVYPARVKFRGFDEKSNTEGYKKVSEFMAQNAEALKEEAES